MSKRDPKIQKAADDYQGFRPKNGGLNMYQCDEHPEHLIITKDAEPGTTPYTIQCPICEEQKIPPKGYGFYEYSAMSSFMYTVHPKAIPTYEWYRPDSLKDLSTPEKEHVLRGGLLMRKLLRPPPRPAHRFA